MAREHRHQLVPGPSTVFFCADTPTNFLAQILKTRRLVDDWNMGVVGQQKLNARLQDFLGHAAAEHESWRQLCLRCRIVAFTRTWRQLCDVREIEESFPLMQTKRLGKRLVCNEYVSPLRIRRKHLERT